MPNLDLDTSAEVSGKASTIVDDTHVKLALLIAEGPTTPPAKLGDYLFSYFETAGCGERLRADGRRVAKIEEALERLRQWR